MVTDAIDSSAPGRPTALAPHHLGLLVSVVTLWGFNFVPIRLALDEVPPFALASARFVLASLPWVFFVRRPSMPWRLVVGYGLAIGVGQFGLLFLGLHLGMPAGLASLLTQVQVLFTVVLAAVILRERVRFHHVAGGVLAGLGVLLLMIREMGAGASATLPALVVVLGAAMSWAIGNVLVKHATGGRGTDMFSLVVWSSLVPPIPLAALSFAFEGGLGPLRDFAEMSLTGWSSLLFMAYGATLFGFAVWNRLLHGYPAAVVSPFALLIPIAGLVSAGVFLGERLAAAQWAAGILVLGGLAVTVVTPALKARQPLTEAARGPPPP